MNKIIEVLKSDAVINRIKGLAWHAGSMIAMLVLQFLIDNGTALELSTNVTIILGLVLAQVTKYINSTK